MRFTKMHGIGNDYVYVNAFSEPLPDDLPALARQVSDRHFGIGSDGLILVAPSDNADARMRMFNADGSESEMCGNGIRCVAKFVYDNGIARKLELAIETGRGVLTLQVTPDERGQAAWIRVNMGVPILDAATIPTLLPGPRVIDQAVPVELLAQPAGWADAAGLVPKWTCVSMGNPHVVLYCHDVARIPLETVGPQFEHFAGFPRRINVHFVQVHSPSEVTMRTWERGSGITWACGTGACAVAVAGVLTGRSSSEVLAHLPGGDLQLAWAGEDQPVFMNGPATTVFTGDWSQP